MAATAALFSSPSLSFPSSSRKPTFYCSAKPRHFRKQAALQNGADKFQIERMCQKKVTARRKEEGSLVKSAAVQKKDKEKDFLYDYDQQVDTIDIKDASSLNAVVKVYCTSTAPDYSLPWQRQRQRSSTSSAFMIGDKKLLTNAHCVERSTQVKVKKRGDDTKYVAKVLARGIECDIALLSVENEKFWEGAQPLTLGHMPCLQDSVTVVGYPLGGDTISVTKGIVSRIEVNSYTHGASDLLSIQIDAAINPGNSGGPAFNEQGECIGVAFQVYRSDDVENIGYVIPTSVVSHFLHDYEKNGNYTGFPSLGVLLQKLENPALCECLKAPDHEGVLVRRVEPTSPAYSVLKKGDVIVSFDGVTIGNEGTVPFRSTERIAFRYLISLKYIGDVAELGIIRSGNHMRVRTALSAREYLVPHHREVDPSYLIVAGLVFTTLTEAFLEEEGEESLGMKLLAKARYSSARFKGEQIVILSQVLAHDVNVGYDDMENQQVVKFNGTAIKNIYHLAHLVDSCKDKYFIFEFEENFLAVLDREESASASPHILKDHGIPSGRSSDLWEPYVDINEDNILSDPDVGDTPVNNADIESEGLVWA
ncbi:hypothetical protein LUZ60_011604 [Juncus effusus]|nr:hypothetical protein LUZ60_011604 [Juncus effusus]